MVSFNFWSRNSTVRVAVLYTAGSEFESLRDYHLFDTPLSRTSPCAPRRTILETKRFWLYDRLSELIDARAIYLEDLERRTVSIKVRSTLVLTVCFCRCDGMAYMTDLKSVGEILVGSNPTIGTTIIFRR